MMNLFNKLKSLLRRLDRLAFRLVKLGTKVDLFFLVLFWFLGRVTLILTYGWGLEMILLLDIWMLPLFCIIKDITKQSPNNQKNTDKPK